jgi:ubiquinone biosynthesis protein COQ9
MSVKKAMENNTDPFETVRDRLLPKALDLAVFDGFTPVMLDRAAREAGVSPAELAAAYPAGVADLLAEWSAKADACAESALAGPEAAAMKIREKVAFGVAARLRFLAPNKEAARRAAATLALPHMAPLASRLVWATADTIWRALGDKSTDFNFYSKRTILSGVWVSTFARWLADESNDMSETRKFLQARIDNVMQFEKLKAKARKYEIDPTGPFSWLARLRYPSK